MSHWSMVLQVARWEFRRFFKPKEVVISWLIFILIALLYTGGKALLRMTEEKVSVAVLQSERLPFEFPSGSSFILEEAAGRSPEDLREAVARKELDALLILGSPSRAELVVSKEPYWKAELNAILDASSREVRIREAQLSPDLLQELLAPVAIEVTYQGGQGKTSGSAETIFAMIFVGLTLWGILVGNSYLFVAITGEKQHRVTESVISAIQPQIWIDGKILGLSGIALTSVLTLGSGSLMANLVMGWLGEGFDIPLTLIDPFLLVQLASLALLGFFFWFAFFGAIAATIDDPNSSSRATFLLLPILPLALAFVLLKTPDALVMKLLGLFPLTSPTVLSGRLVLGEVAWWEFPIAIVLLLGAITLIRRSAGKIFSLGILMYGKEPSWAEIRRQI